MRTLESRSAAASRRPSGAERAASTSSSNVNSRCGTSSTACVGARRSSRRHWRTRLSELQLSTPACTPSATSLLHDYWAREFIARRRAEGAKERMEATAAGYLRGKQTQPPNSALVDADAARQFRCVQVKNEAIASLKWYNEMSYTQYNLDITLSYVRVLALHFYTRAQYESKCTQTRWSILLSQLKQICCLEEPMNTSDIRSIDFPKEEWFLCSH